MIRVGDKLSRKISIYDPQNGAVPKAVPVEATVIWIHPERRFYTIECKMPAGRSFRETEYFYPRCGQMKN